MKNKVIIPLVFAIFTAVITSAPQAIAQCSPSDPCGTWAMLDPLGIDSFPIAKTNLEMLQGSS